MQTAQHMQAEHDITASISCFPDQIPDNTNGNTLKKVGKMQGGACGLTTLERLPSMQEASETTYVGYLSMLPLANRLPI